MIARNPRLRRIPPRPAPSTISRYKHPLLATPTSAVCVVGVLMIREWKLKAARKHPLRVLPDWLLLLVVSALIVLQDLVSKKKLSLIQLLMKSMGGMTFDLNGGNAGSSKVIRLFKLQKRSVRVVFYNPKGSQICRYDFRNKDLLNFPSIYISEYVTIVKRNLHLFTVFFIVF